MSKVSEIITLRASAAEAASATGTGVSFRQAWSEATITLDVTAAATLVGDTLNVYIDALVDGGSKWVNIGAFTQVLGNGGAKTFVMAIGKDNPGATAVYDVTANATAGATRQIGIGTQLRSRSVIAGTGTFTYSVKALLK